tara:strand:- start:3065 stop:3895 length:831 start_codon:yes stop_codon:yes gene_type:complete
MKVLLIQENGRNEQNVNYRECFCLQRAFKSHNHECDVWGLGHDNFNTTPEWESYDWIINLENYDTSNWVPCLADVKGPKKFLWSIDSHCRGEEIYEKTFTTGNYNTLLHSTKDFVKSSHHRWFPNAFDSTLLKPLDKEKKYQVGFCGNYVNRQRVLEWLQREYGLRLDIFVIGDAMVEAINSYKCHFNLNMANDINYRSFETIGCETLLLTNYNYQYTELGFVDGENCLMYKNTEELVEKIEFVKNNYVSKIASEGLKLSKLHTYNKRVGELLQSN